MLCVHDVLSVLRPETQASSDERSVCTTLVRPGALLTLPVANSQHVSRTQRLQFATCPMSRKRNVSNLQHARCLENATSPICNMPDAPTWCMLHCAIGAVHRALCWCMLHCGACAVCWCTVHRVGACVLQCTMQGGPGGCAGPLRCGTLSPCKNKELDPISLSHYETWLVHTNQGSRRR